MSLLPWLIMASESSGGTPPALYNTVIGGQGAITTTAGALETLLGLSGGDVSYFNLSGNDIQAKIDVTYTPPTSCFASNTTITSYIDMDSKLIGLGLNAFQDATNFLTLESDGLTYIPANGLRNTGITTLNTPNVTTVGSAGLRDNSLTTIDLPLLTSTSNSAFRGSTVATLINIPLCATLGTTVDTQNYVFWILNTGCTINCPASLETVNGGGREFDIAYAEDTRGATINYI